MKKEYLILLFFYVFATIFSCSEDGGPADDCNCSDEVVNITFNDLEIEVLEQQDNAAQPSAIVDSVAKQDFLLRVNLPFEELASVAKGSNDNFSLGFSSAYACSCAVFTSVTNQIVDIQVFQKETDTPILQEVTSAFGIVDFTSSNGTLLTVDEALEETRRLENNFGFINQYDFKIVNEDVILNQANFRILIRFQDEITLEEQTSEINFIQS